MTSENRPDLPADVWFVTGTSSGLGRALVEAVVDHGDYVVATARDPTALADLVSLAPSRVAALELDVTDGRAIQAAVAQAHARFGPIDVLVNNAGYGLLGAFEEVTED